MRIYLSLILSCYNEAGHLRESFKRIYSVLRGLKDPYEVIFIDDCSNDKTLSIIKELIKEYKKKGINFRLIVHAKNLGRGKSVVDGIKVSHGSIAGFIDVDLEVGPGYILKALPLFDSYDVVVGQRSFGFSPLTIHRYVSSKIYAWMARTLLNLPIHDSEAGFKFFKKAKLHRLLPFVRNSGWFWDTEIIALSQLFNLKISELPVKYIRRTDKTSTVNTFKDSLVYLWNLVNFYVQFKTGSIKRA